MATTTISQSFETASADIPEVYRLLQQPGNIISCATLSSIDLFV